MTLTIRTKSHLSVTGSVMSIIACTASPILAGPTVACAILSFI
jgi:hypothetical protein